MNKLAKLRQELADLKAKGLALVTKAETEARDFTDAENAQFAAIEADIRARETDIAREEELSERRRRMEAAPPAGGTITVNDPNPATTFGFKSIGEFASSVMGAINAQQVGGTIDPRLVAATPSGTHSGGGSAGEGFSLPPQFREEIWELVSAFDEFGPLIDEEPTMHREVKITADETTPWGSSGIRAYWRAEAAQMAATQLDDKQVNVPLNELYTLALATEELLADAPRLQSRLTRKAAMAIAYKKNLAIVEGNGVGQPLGWNNAPSLVTVAKESGQTADTIVAANVLKMLSRLLTVPGDSPFWKAHKDTIPQLAQMTIGTQPVWTPPNGLVNAPGGFLLGLPVRFSEFASTVGDLNDIQLISPRGYYGVRRTSGADFASSIHLYFDYGIQAFRWMFRYGGRPLLSAAVTPKSGSTVSHFVTLAARA